MFLNNGYRWVAQKKYTLPISLEDNYEKDLVVTFADINGDGFPDLFWRNLKSLGIKINTRCAWKTGRRLNLPPTSGKDFGVIFADLDGNATGDMLVVEFSKRKATRLRVYLGKTTFT